MSRRPRPQSRAFSLIEVLIAAGIFSAGILLLFGTFTLALNYDVNSRNVTVATAAANSQLDQLRLKGFDALAAPATTITTVSSLPQGQMKVISSFFNSNTKIKQVVVEVYWSNRPESRAITLTGLIGQGGIHG